MQIQEDTHGAVTVVKPVGPVTKDDADALKERMLKIRARTLGRLVMDASGIPFVDSKGLEVLVEVNDQLAEGGQALKICAMNDVMREVLELTDLGSTFEQFDDVNAAVRSFL